MTPKWLVRALEEFDTKLDMFGEKTTKKQLESA
jgi:hypothetical protein